MNIQITQMENGVVVKMDKKQYVVENASSLAALITSQFKFSSINEIPEPLYQVMVNDVPRNEDGDERIIPAIKAMRNILGTGLKETKDAIDNRANKAVATNLPIKTAKELCHALVAVGCKVHIEGAN